LTISALNQIVVYRATNMVNGDFYVGCTRNGLATREYQHRNFASNGGRTRLHKAIREFGQDAFVFEELFDFQGDHELALAYEAEMVAKHAPVYNEAPGGRRKVATVDTPVELRRSTRKPVRCVTDGRLFESSGAAAEFYGFRPRHVANAARATEKGVHRSHHGLQFEYVRRQ
jgi:predicted GIY-YIG superfamily endonuclease